MRRAKGRVRHSLALLCFRELMLLRPTRPPQGDRVSQSSVACGYVLLTFELLRAMVVQVSPFGRYL